MNAKIAKMHNHLTPAQIKAYKQRLTKAMNTTKDRAMELEKNVVQYTKQNPIKAIAISFVAGMVFNRIRNLFR